MTLRDDAQLLIMAWEQVRTPADCLVRARQALEFIRRVHAGSAADYR